MFKHCLPDQYHIYSTNKIKEKKNDGNVTDNDNNLSDNSNDKRSMMVKTKKKCSQDISKRVVKKKKLPVGDIQKEIKKKKLSDKKDSKKVDTGSSKKPNQKKSAVIVEKKPKNISKRQLDRFDKEFLPIHSSTGQSRFQKLKSKEK